MGIFHVIFPAIFSIIVSHSETTVLAAQIESQPSYGDQSSNGIVVELHDMNLKIARLGTALEESIKSLNAKSVYLEEREKLIHEMAQMIHDLQAAMLAIKGESSHAEERLKALEEEVRLLWAVSRKNNFDIHVLESKAQATEETLEVVRSQVQKMDDIITEHWIQIRHLEQAVQGVEMRALNAERLVESRRGTFTEKFVNKIRNRLQKVLEMLEILLWGKGSTLSYESEVVHQFNRIFSAAKNYHHQLQRNIKQQMERHKFTAVFANEEVVCFMASALITFPIITAWMFLSSHFC